MGLLARMRRPAPCRPDETGAAADAAGGAPPGDLQRLGAFADQASSLGRQAAEVNGAIEDAARRSAIQAATCTRVAADLDAMVQTNRAIDEATLASHRSVARAREAIAQVGEGVEGVQQTLQQVSSAAGDIRKIALQTRLVAFNASVEARHAGEAGRGFAVVAEAVKDLAARVEQSSRSILGTIAQLDERINGLAREMRSDASASEQNSFDAALAHAERSVAGIATAARHNIDACGGVVGQVQALSQALAADARAMTVTRGDAGAFLSVSEALIELIADSGIRTRDTRYIEATAEAAGRISELLEAEVAAGRIALDDLFDEDYRAVAGSDPAQCLTRFTALTDRLLPPVQEPMLKLAPEVVWCAAVDRNGYLPTHNEKFSRPQGADPVWNAANCRNRRIFDDRTGLAAARSTRRFLLQTYRRDMGGGQFVTMKDLSVPIMVRGRHWGALRIGYRF